MSRLPIPGYEGYSIDPETGLVYNSDGHNLKPIQSKQGPRVELRRPGIRERLLVDELVRRVVHEDSGSVRVDHIHP